MTREERREVREFAGVLAAALLAFGLWGSWREGFSLTAGRTVCLLVAASVVAVAVGRPVALRGPRRLWMRLGRLLARVISPVLLTVFFIAVITPAGLLRRAFGADPLRLRRAEPGGSYWLHRPREQRGRERYEQPF